MGLFSQKPGGTFFGNLLRVGASKAAPGLLGSGANRIEFGQTQTNAQLARASNPIVAAPVGQAFGEQLFGDTQESKTMTWLLAGAVVVLGGVAAYFSGVFGNVKKSYKRKW